MSQHNLSSHLASCVSTGSQQTKGVNESAQYPLTMSEYSHKSREVKTRTSMILHDDQVMLFRNYLLVCVKIPTHRNHKGNEYDHKCVKDHMIQARNEQVM
mgnify:FL=1